MVAQQVTRAQKKPAVMTDNTSNRPSNKVGAAGLGGAVATVVWTLAAATFWKNTFSDVTLASLTGSSATIFAFVLGYFVPNAS
jgi:hypothetical protein